jgi:hypothetical protein
MPLKRCDADTHPIVRRIMQIAKIPREVALIILGYLPVRRRLTYPGHKTLLGIKPVRVQWLPWVQMKYGLPDDVDPTRTWGYLQ